MKRSWFLLLMLLPAVVHAVAAQQPKPEEKQNAAPQIFTLVNNPEKADVIIEIFSTEDNDIAAATTVRASPQTGRPERSASVGKQYAAPEIRLTVYDSKTSFPLWRAIERPKYALKKKDI